MLMDMEILCLNGTDSKLYELVAPLVMNPAVLRQNNNYPFKTGFNYLWYVAVDREEGVVGFIPLKPVSKGYCIDNYYSKGEDAGILEMMIEAVTADFATGAAGSSAAGGDQAVASGAEGFRSSLMALVHKRHTELFGKAGFKVWQEMKRYDKMDYCG